MYWSLSERGQEVYKGLFLHEAPMDIRKSLNEKEYEP
jgi:hypothetical protein